MKFRHLLDWARAHGMEYVVTATMPGWSRTRPPAVSCSKRGWTRARTRATCSTTSLRSSWRISVCRWAACTRLRCARSRSSTDLSMPASTTVRISALCRTATMPALWSSLPASTTLQVIFWIESGRVVGTHSGAVRYTLGQRKGLGLALGAPVYVCGKDMQANTVTVGPEANAVRQHRVRGRGELDRHSGADRAAAGHRPHPVPSGGAGRHRLPGGVRLPAGIRPAPARPYPGQAAVLYQGDTVLGGGTITSVEK